MNAAQRMWLRLRSSLWFVPTLLILLSLGAAGVLVQAHLVDDQMVSRWPHVFGASADGSREMLSAIATAMITVAGVVFSITVVALSLAASQYSPRVLRNFMQDRPTQLVLGVFVGNFAYCMLVLRTIRGGDEAPFIPSMAVLGGMAYALVAVALLIYFIHHVAASIQASSIVSRISEDAARALGHMFPESAGEPARTQPPPLRPEVPRDWVPVPAHRDGYLIAVATDRLMQWARDHGRVVRLHEFVGSFVTSGTVLVEASGNAPLSSEDAATLLEMLTLGRQRTVEQDLAFGFQQLVDVAVKALSPGINDPTTACMCIDRIGSLLTLLARRHIPDTHRVEDGQLRLVAPAPGFRGFVLLAFGAIVRYGRGDADVMALVLRQLGQAGEVTDDPARRHALAVMATAVARGLPDAPRDAAIRLVRRRARSLALSLRGSPMRSRPSDS